MNISESIIPHRAIQPQRLREGKPPILLASLDTFNNPTSAKALRELSIKMYETHRGKTNASEVPHENHNPEDGGESETDKGGAIQFADVGGGIFPIRPKKPTKSRDAPGQAETSKRGSENNRQGTQTRLPDRRCAFDVATRVGWRKISRILFGRCWVRNSQVISPRDGKYPLGRRPK